MCFVWGIKQCYNRPIHSEALRTADGGRISLDWVDNVSSEAYPSSARRPTVLILPGLTGNSQQLYVYHVVSQATRRGYRSVETADPRPNCLKSMCMAN